MIQMHSEEKERLREMRPTIRELRIVDLMRDYESIRKRAFGNSIPKVGDVAFAFVTAVAMKSIFDENCLGFNVYGPRHKVGCSVIAIAIESSITEARMTLLHEMAHIKMEKKWRRDMGHGKHWKAEMRRIAKCGELDNWW